MKFILGKKVGMSQMFDKDGKLTAISLVSVGPCFVLQKKTMEKEGYSALQLGFKKIEKKSKVGKSMKGKEYKYIRETRNQDDKSQIGDEINASVFAEGDVVNVSGMSKGKGFQGPVKRHGFKTRTKTHGQKHQLRVGGSKGTRFPQHTRKGLKMAGRMGFERITVKNLKILKIEPENNLLVIKGAVPGRNGALLEIKG